MKMKRKTTTRIETLPVQVCPYCNGDASPALSLHIFVCPAVHAMEQSTNKNLIVGQCVVKRAMEVAAVGDLSVLLVGPRGGGKRFLASAFPEVRCRVMRTCFCGNYGSVQHECTCARDRLSRWLNCIKVRAYNSDMVIEVQPLPYREMNSKPDDTYAEAFSKRVSAAQAYDGTLTVPRAMDEAAGRVDRAAGARPRRRCRSHRCANT